MQRSTAKHLTKKDHRIAGVGLPHVPLYSCHQLCESLPLIELWLSKGEAAALSQLHVQQVSIGQISHPLLAPTYASAPVNRHSMQTASCSRWGVPPWTTHSHAIQRRSGSLSCHATASDEQASSQAAAGEAAGSLARSDNVRALELNQLSAGPNNISGASTSQKVYKGVYGDWKLEQTDIDEVSSMIHRRNRT